MRLTLLFLMVVFSVSAFAQTPPIEGLGWLTSVISFLQSNESAGPILIKIFEVIAIVSAITTALAAFLKTVLVIPKIYAQWKGAQKLLQYLDDFEKKVFPWLAYFSMFNVQKNKK